MSKITKQQILDMSPRNLRAWVDMYPEDGLKVAWVLFISSFSVCGLCKNIFGSIFFAFVGAFFVRR